MPESPQTAPDGFPYSNGTPIESSAKENLLIAHAGGGDADPVSDLVLLEHHLTSSNPNAAKKLIRNAVWPLNHPIRLNLWLKLCRRLIPDGDFEKAVKHYRSAAADFYGRSEKARLLPLPAFVQDSLTNDYFLNEEGRRRCRRILTVTENCQPGITCAPVLYPLTALFLHYKYDDAEVFACLEAILKPKNVARKFVPETVHAWRSSAHVMSELVRRKLKAVYNFVLHSMDSPEKCIEFFDGWLKWIFVDLPFEVVVRVVDCYLYEGMKVLFRVGLAILKLFHKSLGQPHSVPNLTQSVSRFCQNFSQSHSASELLKMGFSFTRLSQEMVLTLIKQFENQIDKFPLAEKANVRRNQSDGRLGINVPVSFLPSEVSGLSRILNADQFYAIWNWLPARYRIAKPTLLYTTEEHGVSLVTFFQQCGANEPTVLVIKTNRNEIFGAFCSHSWDGRSQGGKNLSYFGNGETFLYTLSPEQRRYQWVGLQAGDSAGFKSSLFMAADSSCIIIGGGGGCAIRFDSSLSQGRSETCATFENAPLCSTKDGDFYSAVVEVFGFTG